MKESFTLLICNSCFSALKSLHLHRKQQFKLFKLLFTSILILFLQTGHAQDSQKASITISGTVKDNKGEPLPGVTVKEKNGLSAVNTDVNGKYRITIKGTEAIIVFSFIGFTSTELHFNTSSVKNLQLFPAANDLNEVIVVGYGTQKRSEITGSVGSVSLKNQDKGAYDNFQQLIAGKVAGVAVTETSGAPGAGLSIEIRGISSINYSSQPLYVVDGVPMPEINLTPLNNGNGNALGATGSSPLAAINPNDIASIEILKDASATAIYGSRGSNGVVLITTKSGVAGKTKINLQYSNGTSQMLKYLKLLNGPEYAAMANEAYFNRNPNSPPQPSNLPFLDADLVNLPSYDHQREITQTATTQDLGINLSGGELKSKYYVSGQYYSQEGIIKSTDLKRYSGKFNYENSLFKNLKLNTQIAISNSVSDGNVMSSNFGGVLANALAWAPTSPLINPDGSFNSVKTYEYGTSVITDPVYGTIYYNPRFANTVIGNLGAALNINNPLSYLNGVINKNTSTQIIGNITLAYDITPNLKLSGVLGVTTYNTLLQNYIPTTTPINSSIRGVATLGNLQSSNLLYQTTLNYNRQFNKHAIGVVIGATAEKSTQQDQSESAQGFSTDATGPYAIQSGTLIQTPTSDYDRSTLISTLFRGNYNYDSRYYLTLSARYDGSSKFAEGNQFGFFPSVGVAWRALNEKWLKTSRYISELKLRSSFGIIGNQAVGSNATLSTLSPANVVLGGSINAGYAPSRLPNPDLKWEQTKQTDIGLDFGLFNNRVLLTADAYHKITSNLIYQISLPGTSGFSTMLKNVAAVENNGLELSLSTINLRTNDFTWSTNLNISFNRNKVLSLSGNSGDFLSVYQLIGSGYLSRIQPGQSIGQFYGYKTIGVWNDETIVNKPVNFQKGVKVGDRRYADIDNDGRLTDNDRVYIGSALPQYSGGFSSTFAYKGLELSAFFTYSYGNKVFNQLNWTLTSMNGLNNVLQRVYDDHYIPITASMDPATQAATIAKNSTTKTMQAGASIDSREVTDYYVENASYLRCRDITLSYNVPVKWLNRLRISRVNVYLNVQNAFTITPYEGYNPEGNYGTGLARGLDNGTYPLARTIRLGATVSF